MKKLLLSKLLLILFVTSCDYQDGTRLLGETFSLAGTGDSTINADEIKPGDLSSINDYQLTNSNTFTDNMKSFISSYVVQKAQGPYDTLVDYQGIYNEAVNGSNVDLRNNIFKQINDFDLGSATKIEKISFYINAYNFLAIDIVNRYIMTASGPRIPSISDILGNGSFRAFSEIKYYVHGELMSLDTLEKTKLKSVLTNADGSLDARFHFAVICAAKGCPVLLDEAYEPSKLDSQLTDITIKSLSLARNYEFDGSQTKLTQLFSWYKDDFINHKAVDGSKSGSIEAFIQGFIPSATVTTSPAFVDYDWALNISN